jgi:mannan endo-1,4-beta-mannosidase
VAYPPHPKLSLPPLVRNYLSEHLAFAAPHDKPAAFSYRLPPPPPFPPQVRFYLSDHLAFAVLLNKPAVLEEFGLARDATPAQGETFSPVPTDSLRRQMYETIFGAVIDALPPMCADTDTAVGDEIGGSADPGGGADTVGGGHFSGVSFWGWAGEGRPRQPGGVWAVGDHLIGDPPHEPQGWYSVYDTDEQMGQLLNRTAAAMRGACGG